MANDKAQPEYIKKLGDWISELESRWGKKHKAIWEYDEDSVRVRLFTDGHEYFIRASADYLGCGANTRKPRPGEDWNRGNDLHDGKFNEESWIGILKDIVANELMSISDYVLSRETEDDDLVQAENQLENT